jgi:hypothetical protein
MQNLEAQLLAAMGTVQKGLEVLRPERTEAKAAARR